ncbi:ADP-ribosylglycohydrolase family protein [uncultured Thiocystis sp.]|jgi:ADP-ribosylglycohydrolase/protein-tyrosine phosphatase|uniref:ADP-ribosylglycohydrolase family protein n=1 Tax=uncultured Thiocystis sp. TaxID=1202134 RepID=UPI0025E4CFA4|nr:ADP-ribosylglycohydrolase family protein [uncultured Thiocystis sp.]
MTVLTSTSHPLRIDAVAAPTGGVIGMTFCPGKQQKHSISGHWDRDLASDLAIIQDWGAEVVVTLMEPEELAAVGVAQLGDAVEALGLDWYHLPIRDVHPPGQRFENRWILYGLKLRRLLRRGGRCVLHCRGGLGRTGTVAARLLVELGLSPPEAINAVRAARPGTIETAAQAAHVLACQAPHADEAFLDRALGCLLGGAVGDGFGYAVEFDSLGMIQQRFGAAGLREPVLTGGQLRVSDDTQMTLFTLEGLARVDADVDSDRLLASLQHAYLDWLATQGGQTKGAVVHGTLAKRQAMRRARAPGNTCLSALKAGGHGTPQRPINDSKGCGAVMRVAPLGWVTPGGRGIIFDRAARAGALTHGHPDGWASAGMLAALIGELCYGKGLRLALQDAKSITAQALAHQGQRANLPQAVQQAEHLAKRRRNATERAIAEIGQGWVGEEALAIALYAVLTANSFEDAIRRATNHSGDSDSTASIAGQIWGAWKGIDSLPMAWVRRLDVLPECLHGVSELAKHGHSAAMTAAMRRNKQLEPSINTCIDILEMVHVLHRRGYQKLRIAPGISSSGCYWRVAVAPSDNSLDDHGALLRDYSDAAHHTSGNGVHPFAWRDVQGATAPELADLFLERYPDLARRGEGSDWPYAGWYLEVLRHVSRGAWPVAYWDEYTEIEPGSLKLVYIDHSATGQMPAPPLPTAVSLASSMPQSPPVPEAPADPESNVEAIDYDEIDLKQVSLYEQAQRVQALIAFYHQWEAALMPFTATVWDSLTEPKAQKVDFMATTLGIKGNDKLALRKVLETYLKETDAAIAAVADIDTEYDILEQQDAYWEEVCRYFRHLDAMIESNAQRWAHLLNGEPMDPPPEPAQTAQVIRGPWLRLV